MMRSLLFSIVCSICACGVEAPTIIFGDDADTGAVIGSLNESQQACMLDVVNDCDYGLGFFDHEIEWDRRAAEALLNHRAGPDGRCGTTDDVILTRLEDVIALEPIGDAALVSLSDFVAEEGCAGPKDFAVVDGVAFTELEALATLDLANSADEALLDDEIGLPATAVGFLVEFRPFDETAPEAGLMALGAVPMVGSHALARLRDYAMSSDGKGCTDLAGVALGVPFTAEQSHDTLDLLNAGQQQDLMQITAIGAVISARILMARAASDGFSVLADLESIPGLTADLLMALRDEVADGWCATAGATCGCVVDRGPEPAVEAALAHAQALLDDPWMDPMRRFFVLLGPANYQRMTTVVLAQLAKRFNAEPPALVNDEQLEWVVLQALDEVLNQKRFTFPFDWLPITIAVPDDPEVARQSAVDALIVELGVTDLVPTLGLSFPQLVATQQSDYLNDVTAWRTWTDPDLAREDLPKKFVFGGWFMDVLCEITVSRVTGHVLDITLHLHE